MADCLVDLGFGDRQRRREPQRGRGDRVGHEAVLRAASV